MDKVERIHFSKEDRQKILEKTNCRCGHCGEKLDTTSMTVEHIYPINKGGDNHEYNLVALCKKCNNEKANFIYAVSDYYGYLDKKYECKFDAYNAFLAQKNCNERLLEYSRLTFETILSMNKDILYKMIKRGASNKKISQAINRLTSVFSLERAYTGDAAEIMELINKRRNKRGFNLDLYTNEYQVLNDIRYGEVYVLRSKNKVVGAFGFKKIGNGINIDILQLNNIENCSSLSKKYVMTLVVLDRDLGDLLPDIMGELHSRMLTVKAIPIFFNILDNFYTEVETAIQMPYTIDGVQGMLEFLPIQHIRDVSVNHYMELMEQKHIEGYTREDIVFYVDNKQLYNENELTEEEHDRLDEIAYALSGKNIRVKLLNEFKKEDRLKENE